MILFLISILILALSYKFYSPFVEKQAAIDPMAPIGEDCNQYFLPRPGTFYRAYCIADTLTV